MKPLKPEWKLNSRLLPFLVGLLFLMQLITPYKGWVALLVGLGGVWLISTLWTVSMVRRLRLTREMRFGWAQVGDRLIERFSLTNDSSLPALWVEIVDHSTLPEYQASRGTGVDGRSSIRWHRASICSRRGLFYLGPTQLRTGDPFGIYTLTIDYPAMMPLLVLPPIVPLPAIEVAPGGRTGEGRPRANAIDRIVSASSVREYVPGDSRRWIHWKTSARRDELYVRLFDGTPSGDWWILLDTDVKVQVGAGEDSTEELGVILAASLADRGIRAGRSVGLLAHSGDDLAWIPPREGEGQRWEILRALALVTQGKYSLAELLHRVKPTLGLRTTLVIITPSLEGAWLEMLVPLMRRGVAPTVLLLDPVSFGGEGST
ncbi:MAG: DUF58 domain-containing protein, partial [Anaerolineae bacterium]|nr:DUF58 domain-containing protein [Anaerolineae bacterium]